MRADTDRSCTQAGSSVTHSLESVSQSHISYPVRTRNNVRSSAPPNVNPGISHNVTPRWCFLLTDSRTCSRCKLVIPATLCPTLSQSVLQQIIHRPQQLAQNWALALTLAPG